jgi:hypothetical protein
MPAGLQSSAYSTGQWIRQISVHDNVVVLYPSALDERKMSDVAGTGRPPSMSEELCQGEVVISALQQSIVSRKVCIFHM